MIGSKYLPHNFRSKKAKRLLELVEKSQKRMDEALDIRNLVESHEDLILFLNKFMGKQRYWLFKRQRKRLISLKHDPISYTDRNLDGVELLDWQPRDSIDK